MYAEFESKKNQIPSEVTMMVKFFYPCKFICFTNNYFVNVGHFAVNYAYIFPFLPVPIDDVSVVSASMNSSNDK